MRLTRQTIAEAPSHINCLGDRTLSLRSLELPVLEHLDALPDIYDTLDITDNDLRSLNRAFPVLIKLRTLLAANNRISSVAFDGRLPQLRVLSLVNNAMVDLASLASLKECKRLEALHLTGNPVASKEYYREFVVWLCPSLQVLDFERVTKHEKERGLELFGTHEEPTALAQQILGAKTSEHVEVNKRIMLTDEEKLKLKEQLKMATSLTEIERIETALKSGYLA